MLIKLEESVAIPLERLIDMDRREFLAEVEAALCALTAVESLNYAVSETTTDSIVFQVSGSVEEDDLMDDNLD